MGLFYCLHFGIDTDMTYTITDVMQAKAFLSQYADTTPPPTEGPRVTDPLPKPKMPRFAGRMTQLPASVRTKLINIRRLANNNHPEYTREQIITVREAFSIYDMYLAIKDTPLWTNTNSKGIIK